MKKTKKFPAKAKNVDKKPIEVAPAPVVNEETAKVSEALDNLTLHAAQEDNSGTFMNPPAKGKRGRKPGTKNKPKNVEGNEEGISVAVNPEEQRRQVEAIKGYVEPVFHMLSTVGVKVAESEQAAIGAKELVVMVDAAANCINQYLPDVLGRHAHLTVLSVTMASWGIRVYMIRQAKIEELRANMHRESAGGFTAPVGGIS